jgi:plasmid stabilization system protein ParE
MRYKSVIENLAKEDLREAVKWYDSQQIGLGEKFLANVKKTINQLKSYPEIAQIRYHEVHTAVVEVYPYLIHYYVDLEIKTIIIIGILHTSRDTSVWDKRK